MREDKTGSKGVLLGGGDFDWNRERSTDAHASVSFTFSIPDLESKKASILPLRTNHRKMVRIYLYEQTIEKWFGFTFTYECEFKFWILCVEYWICNEFSKKKHTFFITKLKISEIAKAKSEPPSLTAPFIKYILNAICVFSCMHLNFMSFAYAVGHDFS